ncbi:PREDICTED: uncharacterized protein C2orf78 homolog [Elephantulus edwardii]|uniref:uncharacterized protein C2orf78 homolog n=1 Tax=Elephantulus edwardii TaxID=28737 RepID=UPI0003F0EBBE|nr:PREDICTED: uncharacterized protein C2orf78 homolog [Elephantulus edwardii]
MFGVNVSSLTMSENFPQPSLLGTPDSLQLSLPVASNTTPFTGSNFNFSRVSAPAGSSEWLLPSASGTSLEPLLGSAYLYQPSSTTMLSAVSDQHQSHPSPASYPGIFGWDLTGSTEKKSSSLKDSTVTVTDQDTARSSVPVAIQHNKPADTNTIVPLYPSLPTSLVRGTPNQGHSLSVPHQEGSQVYYYSQGPLGTLLPRELGPCLQSYTGGRTPAPQPEMVMVLTEIQPTNALQPDSASGVYYSVSEQAISEASFQVMDTSLGTETSLRLHPSNQILCLSQTPDLPKSGRSRNIQILESNRSTKLEDNPVTAPCESSSNLLALPPAPRQEQTENQDLEEVQNKLLEPPDVYQVPIKNQDAPLVPLETPDVHHLLACLDTFNHEGQTGSESIDVTKDRFTLNDQETLENEIGSGSGFADLTKLVEDIHVRQLFNSMEDLHQPKDLKVIKAKEIKAIQVNQVQETSSLIMSSSDQVRESKHEASEPISGSSKSKIEAKIPEKEVIACNPEGGYQAPTNTNKCPNIKPLDQAALSRISKKKSQGQEKMKRTRKNTSKKAGGSEQSVPEEKPSIPKSKRKKNQPEFGQETFQKPRSSLGMHMLESVQVFHALGKKRDHKAGPSSSLALGISSNTKYPQPSPAVRPRLHIPPEGQGPEKTQVRAQQSDGHTKKHPSSSQDKLPPPGKVKLVPLPFLTLDKPQVQPAPCRPQSLASNQPLGAQPPGSGSTNSALSILKVNESWPAPANASEMSPAKPAWPTLTNPGQPAVSNPPWRNVLQGPPRPAAHTAASGAAFQREPVTTVGSKLQPPSKPQAQFLLQDFSFQQIPWKKPNVPEPVMSKPITNEQRPEREAMKRRAQQERENAAKYTSLGKVQFFVQREKDMDIARYYGYAI